MSWQIVSASVIGNAHIENNIPCQDSLAYKMIDNNCGIAIVADGAGSCDNSHIGSNFVAKEGIKLFEKLISEKKFNEVLPEEDLWRFEAIAVAKELSKKLEFFAKNEELDFKSLSSTFIVSFFFRDGICSLNIGDGRGAFRNNQKKWKSIVKPFHGEQVGMTVFLTTKEIWENTDLYISTSIFKEDVEAFIVLSDGYEKISFECYCKKDDGSYHDPNRPFNDYLNFVFNSTVDFLKNNPAEEVSKKWEQFLKDGHDILKNENDDKTMVFGIFNRNK